LRATLWEQAREIAAELKEKHLAAKTVQVRVRYGDFTTLTRQMTLEDNISEARDLYRLGCVLLARHKLVGRPLRLLGLGASSLGPPSQQLRLPLEGV
jgi:DNA polymerase-4